MNGKRDVGSSQTGLDEAQLRAHTYSLLANLLATPATEAVLEGLRSIDPGAAGDAPLASAWASLGEAARGANPDAVDDEYHALFIGLGRGELLPFASWYREGRLLDKPLVRLRTDLVALGLRRREGVPEPEDHAAALCEAMALLALADPEGSHLATQSRFFADHLEPWMPTFFRDLQEARTAGFFRAVGRLGEAFLDMEKSYLEAEDPGLGAAKPA